MPDGSLDEAPKRRNGQRVRPVEVPGSITGLVAPGTTDEANGGARGEHEGRGRWRSVRLHLGSGARDTGKQAGPGRHDAAPAGPRDGDALGATAMPGPGDGPADTPPAGRRRRVLVVALGVLAAVVIVVQFVLLLGHDQPATRRTVSVPSLTSAPPASTRVTSPPVRFVALKRAGAARATATLGNAGHELVLSVRAFVPGRVYGVALTSHGVRARAIVFSRGGRAANTLRIGWRGLARYRTLAVFVQLPAARQHRAKGRKGKHRGAAPHKRTRMIMRLSVNKLVRDSGVRLVG